VRARAFLRGTSCFEKHPEAHRPDVPTVAPGCSNPSDEQRRRYCSLRACGVAVADGTKRTGMAFALVTKARYDAPRQHSEAYGFNMQRLRAWVSISYANRYRILDWVTVLTSSTASRIRSETSAFRRTIDVP
jgi:hypothetical protein